MNEKKARTDHPINALLAERWSPYGFEERPVATDDLRSLFEAARWAPSSYNEQPWSFFVATKADPEAFRRLLSCLVEANQEWAKAAPVLVLSVVSRRFSRNGRENRAAVHDLGLAAANLVVEATSRGLHVHQMIGIVPEKAREAFQIPEHFEAWTAMAIGYRGDPAKLPEGLKDRDLAPRSRKSLRQFVFAGPWGDPSPLARKDEDSASAPAGFSNPTHSMWDSFQWLNSPANWQIEGEKLSIDVSPNTDFWRKTHYGFIRDSGHFFYVKASGDFVAEVRVRGDYAALYDQGGLMLRASDEHWMKCGIEYVDGTQQASVVVTNDYSDWSVRPLCMNPKEVWFRVKRQESSLEVFWSPDGSDFAMLRTAYLKSSPGLDVGVMCAAPQGPGFHIAFSEFRLNRLDS